jgi:hypothetical protein
MGGVIMGMIGLVIGVVFFMIWVFVGMWAEID